MEGEGSKEKGDKGKEGGGGRGERRKGGKKKGGGRRRGEEGMRRDVGMRGGGREEREKEEWRAREKQVSPCSSRTRVCLVPSDPQQCMFQEK